MTLPDVDSLSNYGGALSDYFPVEDPTTDRAAAAANQGYASAAAATHTIGRSWVRFVTSATAPALTTVNSNDAVWGNAIGVLPVLARVSAGLFTITWPATVIDELGATHTINLRRAEIMAEGGTLIPVQCTVTAANVVTVYVFTTAGAASDQAGTTLHLQAY